MVLIFISIMANDVEYLFMSLVAIHISFFGAMSKFFLTFKLGYCLVLRVPLHFIHSGYVLLNI